MLYFSEHNTKEDTKRLYFMLCKSLHPDKGGNAEDFIELKRQYDNWVPYEPLPTDYRMPFGKWEGYEIKTIRKSYLEWLISERWFNKEYPSLATYIKNHLKTL